MTFKGRRVTTFSERTFSCRSLSNDGRVRPGAPRPPSAFAIKLYKSQTTLRPTKRFCVPGVRPSSQLRPDFEWFPPRPHVLPGPVLVFVFDWVNLSRPRGLPTEGPGSGGTLRVPPEDNWVSGKAWSGSILLTSTSDPRGTCLTDDSPVRLRRTSGEDYPVSGG